MVWPAGQTADIDPTDFNPVLYQETSKVGILVQMALGLRAFATQDYELSSVILSAAAPKVSNLGGSHAQNQLFQQIADLSWTQTQTTTSAAA